MLTFTEKLLGALPPPGDPVTIGALAQKLGGKNRRVVRSMDALRRRGLVERLEDGLYKLTAAGEETRAEGIKLKSGPNGPHTGIVTKPAPFRQALWQAFRLVEGSTTLPDLLSLIPEGLHSNDRTNGRKYLGRLVEAGYAVALDKRDPGTAPTSNGFKRYRLIRNTGPKAPFWSIKHQRLVDPNTNGETCDG